MEARFPIAYRDELPSGQWGNAAGGAAPSFANYTINGIVYRKITMAEGDALTNNFEIPHTMKVGTIPEIHVHLRPTTNATGTIDIAIDYEWSKTNLSGAGTILAPVGQTQLTATLTIATGSAAYPHYILSLGNLASNAYVLGDLIGFKITYLNTGGYNDPIILEQVALHVADDSNGSDQIYTKKV